MFGYTLPEWLLFLYLLLLGGESECGASEKSRRNTKLLLKKTTKIIFIFKSACGSNFLYR